MSPTPRAALLQKIVHLLTALVLALKAITKLAHPHGLWPVILFFLASAAWILAITLLHGKLHHHTRLLDASVLAIETLATALVAFVYHLEGKHALPWVTALAALGFAIALLVHLRQTPPGNGPDSEGVTGA